ncbi:MAG: peptidylprolyl isomerase [Pseudomonadota bacterium]
MAFIASLFCLIATSHIFAEELTTPMDKLTKPESTTVEFKTSMGDIVIRLYDKQVPVTTENFIQYVKSGFFKDTVFHRVVPGFVIQGGGHTADLERKETKDPIINEAKTGPQNKRGTLSMARTSLPNSATSQFFINLVDNSSLDPNSGSAGYAVFGEVIEGMNVVDSIAAVPTNRQGMHQNVPIKPIVVLDAKIRE